MAAGTLGISISAAPQTTHRYNSQTNPVNSSFVISTLQGPQHTSVPGSTQT